MKVRALRGVCVGVAQHLVPGDVGDVDAATAVFLLGIRAVEPFVEPAPAAEPVQPKVPAKAATIKEK